MAFLVVGVAASGVLQPAAAWTFNIRDFLNENNNDNCNGLSDICIHQGEGDNEIITSNIDDINFDIY